MEMVTHTLYDGGIQKQEQEKERKASLLLCISGSRLLVVDRRRHLRRLRWGLR